MKTDFHADPIASGKLKLLGLILGALEDGRMPMHAKDYQDMSAQAMTALASRDTAELKKLRYTVPGALIDIVDNLLFSRMAQKSLVQRHARR